MGALNVMKDNQDLPEEVAPQSFHPSYNPFDDVVETIDRSAAYLDYDAGIIDRIKNPKRQVIVSL
jgi:hypothetical protein